MTYFLWDLLVKAAILFCLQFFLIVRPLFLLRRITQNLVSEILDRMHYFHLLSFQIAHQKVMLDIFTFFYINRGKYWFWENFRLPVFDGFTRFEMFWTRFECFWKICVNLSMRMWQKIYWYLSAVGENLTTAVATLFPEFSRHADLGF